MKPDEQLRVSADATDATDWSADALSEEISKLSGIGGWEIDLPSMRLRWTRQVCRLLEIDEQSELTTEILASHFGVQDRTTIEARVRDVLDQGSNSEAELDITTGAGRRRLVKLKRRVEYHNAQPVRIIVTVQDITEAKVHEARLQRSNDRLAAAIEASGLRLWEIDLSADTFRFDPLFVHANNNIGPSVPVPRSVMNLLMHPEDRERVLAELDQVALTGAPLQTRWRIVKPDSEPRLLQQLVLREVSEDGLHRLFGVGRDITDDVAQQQELVAKRIEAEAASAAKSEFVARMSHEIRTPLTGVIGMLEVLLRSTQSPEHQDHTETALRSARNLMHILDDVIDVSQLEANRLAFHKQPFNPKALVTDVVELFDPRATEKSLRLGFQTDDALPAWLMGDERRLRQVLTNLVGNALKFTEDGNVHVSARFDSASDILRFEVCDTGIGIAADNLLKLFQPFFQAETSTTRRYGGSGLGLSICRRLVDGMGGQIGVWSEIGQGSTFWVEVPAPLASEPDQQIDAAEAIAPLRILVAEDNLATQRILKALLASDGHTVTFADNGQIAVAKAASDDFDVIIMDVMMPVMDGPTATREIRTLGGRSSGVPIIALTANALVGDRDRYLAAGMTDYLSKPIEVEALFKALARASSKAH